MTKIEEVLWKEIKENNKADLFNRNNDISFERAEELIKNMGEKFQKENICAFSELNFLGFRFGNGERQKRLESLYFKIYKNKYHIFEKELKKKENIISFFKEMDSKFLPDFYDIMMNTDTRILSKIDMNQLPELNQELFQVTKEKLEKKISSWEYGYYTDVTFGAKRTFQIIYCRKDTLDKNIEIVCRFTQAYCSELLKEGVTQKKYQKFYSEDVPILLSVCSEAMRNIEVASDFVAYTRHRDSIKKLLTETVLDTTEIIIKAIQKNPKCYVSLPKKYQMDKDICIHVIHTDLSCIYDVIRYGSVSEEVWKENIIQILGGKI